jgi:hypothetical protein
MQCAVFPLVGNGTDDIVKGQEDTTGPFRPKIPPALLATRYSMTHPVPTDTKGKPFHGDVYAFIYSSLDLKEVKPAVNVVDCNSAKAVVKTRCPKCDVSAIDKLPPPKP